MKTFKLSPTFLSYAIRFRYVFKLVSQLCFFLGIFTIVPLLVSLVFREYGSALRYIYVILFYGTLGGLGWKLPPPKQLQTNEAYVVTGATFLLSSLVLSFPFMGISLPFWDAWFEAISAVTTTGLTTITNLEKMNPMFLFGRAWAQWYGGLGIIILSLGAALYPTHISKKFSQTLSDTKSGVGGSHAYAKRLVIIYVVLTTLCILALWFFQEPLYDSCLIAMATVSTGGLMPFTSDYHTLRGSTQVIIALFSILGALSFPLYWIRETRFLTSFISDIQSILLLIGIAVTSSLLLILFYTAGGNGLSLQGALFSAISAQTTAGFMDASTATNPSKLALILSMFFGGCTHSTAGGFKIIRFLIMIKIFQTLMFRTTLAKNAVYDTYMGRTKLSVDELMKCLSLFFLYLTVIFISWFFFVLAGYDGIDALFEVISAIGTVGTSSGITSSDLPLHLKGILSIDMFLGRLEMIPFILLFYPRTFIGRRLST